MSNLSQRASFAEEIQFDATTFTGAYQALDPLPQSPVILIIQNDTDVTVTLSQDGVLDALTLVSGTKLVLDMRANHGNAANWAFSNGTTFSVKGAVGTGLFKISTIYAVP